MSDSKLKSYLVKILHYLDHYKGRIIGKKARFDLLNLLIQKYNYKTYLEIGVSDGICLKGVKCSNKTGVDPNPTIRTLKNTKIIIQTSDEFFNECRDKFDLIFIDGLHTHKQSYRDFQNALRVLNKNGRIVLHDCSPLSVEFAKSFDEGGKRNGDVFKTLIEINSSGEYTVFTVDIDNGCGVIRLERTNKTFPYELNYQWLDKNRKMALNLISWNEFINLS